MPKKKKQKVLIVSPYFAPAWGFGGPPKITHELGRRLVQRGYEVHAYTTDALNVEKRIELQEEVLDGIHIRRFRNISNYLASGLKLFFPRGFKAHLQKNIQEFDVIFCSDFRCYQNAVVVDLAEKYNIPWVIAAYGQIPRVDGWRGWMKVLFDKLWGYRLVRNAKKCLAQTEHEGEEYKKLGVLEENIALVPLALEPSDYEKLPPKNTFRTKHQIPNTAKIVLFLGRFHEYKLTDMFIEAFAQVLHNYTNAILVIAGRDDGNLAHIKRLVLKKNIEHSVYFPGPLFGNDKLAALNDADIFAMAPSHWEETTTAGLEALAAKTAVVITEQCAIPHLDEYKAGFTTSYNKDDFANAIEKVLDSYELRTEMGENGKKLIEEVFSWEIVVKKFEKIFNEATT